MWDFLATRWTNVVAAVLVLGHGRRGRHGRDAKRELMRSVECLFTIGIAALMWSVVPAHAGGTVIVHPDVLEPPVLHTITGTRVGFENRTGRAIHLEFEGDRGQHDVIQLPVTGPFWGVFHRPGAHPYVVHVYERTERRLRGVVEVAEDEEPFAETAPCDVAVMGACIEP